MPEDQGLWSHKYGGASATGGALLADGAVPGSNTPAPATSGMYQIVVNFQTGTYTVNVIENLDEPALIKSYSVQGFNLSGIGIIIHVTEHYSYHTGQIAFWIKILKNKGLGFYSNVDLNIKNRN